MISQEEIETGILNLLAVNMGHRPEETVLVLNDIPGREEWNLELYKITQIFRRSLMARLAFEILREKFPGKVFYYVFPMVKQSGMEPPFEVAQELLKYDIILAMTTCSLSHTNARKACTLRGARFASMPGIVPEMLSPSGPLAANYEEIKRDSEMPASLLTTAQTARIMTEKGTDLSLSLEGRIGKADTGLYLRPGEWGNLPGGEVNIAPVEGSAQGKLIVPSGWGPGLTEDLVLIFHRGYLVECQGGGAAGEKLRDLLHLRDPKWKHRRNCAELGIGTNPLAKRADIVLEGTVHVAIGDNIHIGGKTESDFHKDFVIPDPTLILDGKVLIENGKYQEVWR